MQNFTLGKKGISMLFFTFYLLIGNSLTFAQSENCPTVTIQDPGPFCYLSTIADLTNETGAEANGDGLRWYRTNESPNPIPIDELLSSGVYWAGNDSGNCVPGRIEVNVTVDDAGAPSTQFGNTFAPCEFDEADVSTVQDLIDNVDASTQDGETAPNEVEIFASEFGETPMDPATRLIEGNSYFAGQINRTTGCRTSRIALRYDPVMALAPTGEAIQQFCTDATVGDLEATFTSPDGQAIRWYSTPTSSPALASTTPLVDGEMYYASQIVNRQNSTLPPCESIDRFEVTVEIQEPVDLGAPAQGIICESDVQETFPSIDEIRKYYIALLPEGTPTDGTLNPTAAQLADIYQNDEDGLGDFTTVYTVGMEGCESSVELTATIVAEEEANAGTIEDIVVECEDDTIVILDDSLLSEDATTGGTFTGEGVNENGNFDPAIGPGTYTITYAVDDSADCVIEGTSDSTTFDITVQGSELGDPIVMEMCITEVQEMFSDPSQAEAFFNNILLENGITNFDGSFNPSENVVGNDIFVYINSNPTAPETFNTTYSLTSSCGEEFVDITLTINNTEEPNAGEISAAPVCSSATLFDLNSLLGQDNDPGGIFSDENGGIEDGLFDVSQTGTYNIIYTVTESTENCTAGEPDSTEFALTVNEGIVAESPAPVIVCESDVDALFPSEDEIRKFYIAIAQQAGFPTNGTLNPNQGQLADQYQADEDGLGDFITTYTFGDGDCQTSVELTVTIIPITDANAGTIEDVIVDCNDQELIVLASLANEGGNSGGTFTGEGVENGNFDPSVGPGTYTITYTVDDTADCVTPGTSDVTTFTITVQSTFDLGAPIVMEMCITEVEAMLANPQLAIDLFNDAIAERTDGDLSGEFTPSLGTVAGQIAAYLNDPTPSQTFETLYSVSTNCGDDSLLISLTINDVTEATTGDIEDFQVCVADSTINLFDRLSDDNTQGGTFSNEDGEIVDGLFNTSQIGEYTITYTVSEDDEDSCVEGTASTQFTITVTDEIILENPSPAIVCESDVDATFPSIDEIRKFYVALIPAGIPTTGTFNPTPTQLAQIYQNDEDGLGDFTTTYTVQNGECSVSVELTARIVAEEEATTGTIADIDACLVEGNINLYDRLTSSNTPGGTFSTEDGVLENGLLDVSEEGVYTVTYTVSEDDAETCLTGTASTEFTVTVSESTFDAGADNSIEVCNDDVRNLNDTGVRNLFLGLLDEGVPTNGTFNPTISQLINQYNIVSNYGDFTTTYTLGEGDCADSAILTVTVIEANDAGADMELTFCETEGPVNLFDFLSPDATTNGTFEGLTNGIFDPSNAVLGETVITYEVEDDESVCSTGNFTATFTINVVAPAPANAGDDQTPPPYCVTDDQDIALVSLLDEDTNMFGSFEFDGQEITTFNPAELGIGEFVITYSLDEDDCAIGTDSATITIIVTATPDAPVADANQSFCLIDNPTVADITVTGENVIIYEDEALTEEADSTNTLANEAVYYAVSTSGDNGCNSEAVMITVTLTDGVAPTLQTEGNEFCRSDNPTIQDLIDNLNGSGIQIYQASSGGVALATSTALEDGVTYFASGTDSGCESSERLGVQVEVAFCGIPEAFSPNGDTINDRFVIPDIAIDFPNYTIEIFNRWGNVVFKGNSSTGDWDGVSNQSGTLGDDVLAAGVYFYILNYNDGQTAPIQGKVYLSR